MGELLDLMICRIPGLRGEDRIELAKKFDKEDDFSLLSKKDIESVLGKVFPNHSWDMVQIRAMAENDSSVSRKLGIHRVSWRETAYPPLLREIYDPPLLLFYRGTLPNPEKPLVAVVGTRKPSQAGAARAFTLGRELGEEGISVVSGLALGIDAMAHRGNIEGSASTVAVLGSGPDQVYPSTNRNLARRILETGGVILSEYPPGTGPKKWNFPVRNRIISALARGVVIVEAPEKSGALITARCALEQNRDLWVDSIGVSSCRGRGTARLAEEGAALVSSVRDILAEWNLAGKRNGAPHPDAAHLDVTHPDATSTGLASSLAGYLDIEL